MEQCYVVYQNNREIGRAKAKADADAIAHGEAGAVVVTALVVEGGCG